MCIFSFSHFVLLGLNWIIRPLCGIIGPLCNVSCPAQQSQENRKQAVYIIRTKFRPTCAQTLGLCRPIIYVWIQGGGGLDPLSKILHITISRPTPIMAPIGYINGPHVGVDPGILEGGVPPPPCECRRRVECGKRNK